MDRILSEKKREKVTIGGYTYRFDKNSKLANNVKFWRCDKKTCLARIHTREDTVMRRRGEHTHGPNVPKVEAAKVVSALKERAVNTREGVRQIMGEVLETVSEAVAVELPSKSSMIRSIQRERNRNDMPPLPQALEQLGDIPDELKVLHDGTNFLAFDSGQGPTRILIFATPEGLQLLHDYPHWFVDGTFQTAPGIFAQIFSLHVIYMDTILPVVFALLPSKSRNTYDCFLQALKTVKPGLQPATLMTDFERSVISAFQTEFPGIEVSGCHFHLAQNVWRKVQSEGLAELYKNDNEFARFMRMLPALAFMPSQDVQNIFEEIFDSDSDDFDQRGQPVVDYFEDVYIGRPRRNGRRHPPMFSIDLWIMHERALLGTARSNNAVEGWHNAFQAHVGAHYPNLWRLIRILQREHGLIKTEMTRILTGQPPPPKRRKYKDLTLRIQRILQQHAQGHRSRKGTLHGLAYALMF